MHMLDATLAVTGSVVLDRGICMSINAGWLYTVVAGDQRPAGRTGYSIARRVRSVASEDNPET